MLCGFPVALCAVIVAFHRSSGLVFAFLAFALVASQILLVTCSIGYEIGAYPIVVGLIAISSLGTYGVIRARHPIVRPERRRSGLFGYPATTPVVPLSREPTTKTITKQDVLGRWRFYLDAASKTVTVEFHADGTYAQSMVDNRGEATDCRGGTWTLTGPNVELTSYTSAGRATVESVRWWMIDTSIGTTLFGADEPEGFVMMTRESGS